MRLVMSADSRGLHFRIQRLGVTPLVWLMNLLGSMSTKSEKSVCFKSDSTQSVPLTAAKLLQSTAQHAMREIYREYRPRYCHAVSQKRQRKISRAAADVEDCRVGIGQGRAERGSGATPPHAIDVRREHVVEKVVARRYRVEHLLYGLGCVYLILNADRLGAHSRHDLRASFACESM